MGFFKIPSFFDAFLTGQRERKTYKQVNVMRHWLYLTKIKPNLRVNDLENRGETIKNTQIRAFKIELNF